MLPILNNDIQDFRNVSLFTAVRANLPGFSRTYDKLQNSTIYRDQLDKLINNLGLIQTSIQTYKAARPSMSKTHKIMHFSNLSDFKIWILSKTLPKLIAKITTERTREQGIIDEKLDLVQRAQRRFSRIPQPLDPAAEVNAYFQLKITELQEGKNPALQSYYHSTKNIHFNKILQSKCLKQFHAPMGRGAYVSTNIEYEGYGPYAFALGANAVHSYSAKYFSSRSTGQRYQSTWIRVHHAIPLKHRTVAHVTVGTPFEKGTMETRIQGFNLNVPVITRAASDCIADLFDDEGRKHYFPKNWKKLRTYDSIAPNVVQFGQATAAAA